MGMRRLGLGEFKSLKLGEKNDKILSVILTITLIFLSNLIIQDISGTSSSPRGVQPEIEFLAINVIIDNNYAVTNIQEKFNNPYSYPIDETFQFEIPAKAFISNFSLMVNDEIHYSKIVSSDEGKEKYNKAVLSGSDAGLVESKDKNIFTYSISLSPNSETVVGLRYEQFLEKSLGGYKYIIPLKSSDVGNNIMNFSIDITVTSKLLITDLEVESHPDKTNISLVSDHEYKLSYNTTSSTPDEDFIVIYELASPPVNGTMLSYNDGHEEYFFHIFSPQKSDLGNQAMPKEIIFVLDKSGSMAGKKIQQLKAAFDEIINQLRTFDRFNLIMFDSTIKKYKNELISASAKNKLDAVEYINSILAGGSTNINGALVSAFEMFESSETMMPIIVMLTDGLPTSGERDTDIIRENIKNRNKANVSLFCLGFGFDVDFGFLKALALENFGIAIRIYEGEDASEQITDFYDTISTPLLRRLTFSYSDGAYEFYPKYVDHLFEGTEIVVVGKYNGTPRNITATVTATSWEGLKTFTETFELEDPIKHSFKSQLLPYNVYNDTLKHVTAITKAISWEEMNNSNRHYKLLESTNNSFIPRFWAYAKIRYLLDDITVYGEKESLVENITALAMIYGFVTPYTSLLVEIPEPTPEPDPEPPAGDGTPEPKPDPKSDDVDSNEYFDGGSEGESESESEAECESESEADDATYIIQLKDDVESAVIEVKDTLDAEAMDEKAGANTETENKKKNESETESKNESEAELESGAKTEQNKNNWITISITNNNKNQCRIYWLGIHFDWQAENIYYICTNITFEDPIYIIPGDTKQFHIYFENPNNIQIANQSYDVLFKYELQDGWFGEWNDYYWQSKTRTGFNISEKDVKKEEYSDVVVPVIPNINNDEINSPSPILPGVLNGDPKINVDDNDEITSSLDNNYCKTNIEDDVSVENGNSDTNAQNSYDSLDSGEQKRDKDDEFEIVNIFLYVVLSILIVILIILSFIVSQKNRRRA